MNEDGMAAVSDLLMDGQGGRCNVQVQSRCDIAGLRHTDGLAALFAWLSRLVCEIWSVCVHGVAQVFSQARSGHYKGIEIS